MKFRKNWPSRSREKAVTERTEDRGWTEDGRTDNDEYTASLESQGNQKVETYFVYQKKSH